MDRPTSTRSGRWQTRSVTAPRVTAPGAMLTSRETEVLDLVRQRLSNAEIATQLFVSVRTVESHVSALLRKLGAEDRRALAQYSEASRVADRGPARVSLPAPLTPFVGRTLELAELVAVLRDHRLVTATGPGGVGKTRLAIAAGLAIADEFDDGVAFVDLVKVTEPAMVVAAVADAMGVPERAGASREDTLIAALADRHCLLVIDNCEHVQDVARVCIERLLTGCASLRVLATSRVRLMLPFEHVFAVPGMSLGGSDHGGDAVTLFLERMVAAGAKRPVGPEELDTVQRICEALDGMALAIELAAARAPGLGIDGLSSALGSRLHILTVGSRADDRHRSLRAAIDWSYDLLADTEQATLRAAAVFAAPFDLDSLCRVIRRPPSVVFDALARLVDWNLVSLRTVPSSRYRVLETIRQYITELDAFIEEVDALRANHLEWCRSRLADLLDGAPGDDSWCADVDSLLDDARSALAHAGDRVELRGSCVSLAGLLADVAFQRGIPAEAQRRYSEAARLTEAPIERRRWLRLAAGAAAARNVGRDTVDLLLEAAAVAVEAGRHDDAAHDLANAAALQFRAQGIIQRPVHVESVDELLRLARATSRGAAHAAAAIAVAAGWAPRATARSQQDTDRALGLAQAADQPLLLDEALDQLTALQLDAGDLVAAAATIDRRLSVLAQVPVDALSGFEYYDARHMACQVNLAMGRLAAARGHADAITALPFFRQERHLGLGRRIGVDAMAGDFAAAVAHADLFESDWRRAGRPVAGNLAPGAYAVAMVFGILGDDAGRERWTGITRALLPSPERMESSDTIWRMVFDALLALHRGDPEGAAALLTLTPEPSAARLSTFHSLWLSWYAAVWAEATVLTSHSDARPRLRQAGEVASVNEIALAIVERAEALQVGHVDRLPAIAVRLADLGCDYQAERTRTLAGIASGGGG